MKTIIAGSRTINDYDLVKRIIQQSGFTITEIVCGMAQGVDILGEQYGLEHNIPITYFPPDWKSFGKVAGFVRNEQMGDYSNAAIIIWDGKSRGSMHMYNYATKKNLLVYLKNIYVLNLMDVI